MIPVVILLFAGYIALTVHLVKRKGQIVTARNEEFRRVALGSPRVEAAEGEVRE